MEGEGERVAKAQCPDSAVHSASRVVIRIVGGNRPVGIDAKHFAEEIGQRLRVRRIRIFAHGHVELSIQTEMNRPSVVVAGGAEVV